LHGVQSKSLMRLRSLAILALLSSGATAGSVARAAAPILDVRARLQLDVARVGRVGEFFVVRGTVRDDAGTPLADRRVTVRVIDPDLPAVVPIGVVTFTTAAGHFEVNRPVAAVADARWRVTVEVDGDEHHAAPPPVDKTVDLRRRAVSLAVAGPASVAPSAKAMRVEVALGDDGGDDDDGPTLAPVSLFVAGVRAAEVRLDRVGRGETTLPLEAALLKRGALVIEARYPGDSTRAPAEGRTEVRVLSTTRLQLELAGDELPRDGRLVATVTLSDDEGAVAGEPIALVEVSATGERDEAAAPLAAGVTGADGRVRLELAGGALGLGPRFVEARYQPTSRTRAPSRSALVPLTVVGARGGTLVFYAVPLALVGAVLAARLVRARRARGSEERRRRPTRREHDAALSGGGTLVEARPTLLAALRAANDLGVAGRVEDGRTGAPLQGARVLITDGAGVRREVETDAAGRFAVEGIAPGAIALTIEAQAFVPEEIARELPHRGELRGLVVKLVPIKERVLAAWRALALPLLPNPAQAATLTPRELLALARRRFLLVGDDGALASLTALVEEACFGPRAPDLALLAEAERRCASARNELAPASP
jgi:protocatechuate 3,4-dioxygenase beta subunit